MGKTYKKPYTKSKAFDKSCRCNGGCPACYSNRMHKNIKHPSLIQELKMLEGNE